jgi:hypothetical protein
LGNDATATPAEQALRAALARHREVYQTKVETIERDVIAGHLSRALAADAMRTARISYERACDLAEIEAATGWHAWAGVGGILYASHPKSSPPIVVRAPSTEALREAIERSRDGQPR